MFSLREKLTAVFTVNGFCDEVAVKNALQKAFLWVLSAPNRSVKDWYNQWYGHAL